MKFSYHTHCEFCDGRADAETMARAALASGYSILGFSSHAPLPFETSWNLKTSRIYDYQRRIRTLADRMKPEGLTILLGLEADYISQQCAPDNPFFQSIEPDYRIGSVHYVKAAEGDIFTVDEPADDFDMHLRQCAHGDIASIWRAYYANMTAMIKRGGFDILGHFDLVRKNNGQSRLFDEAAPDYVRAAFDTIDALSGKDIIVEINTGGMARGKTDAPYPSLPMLRRMREQGIRVTLGDDAHAPEHMGPYNHIALEHAKNAGYASLFYLGADLVWHEISLEDAGRGS